MNRHERRRHLRTLRKLCEQHGLALADTNPASTAYHEAAHSVVSTIFGWKIDYTTIIPGTYDGALLLGFTQRDRVRFIEPLIAFMLAEMLSGNLAEARYSQVPPMLASSDAYDIREIFDRCSSSMDERQRRFRTGWILCDGLIHHSAVWSAIRQVADLLLQQKTVQGQAVRDAVDSQQIQCVPSEVMQQMNSLNPGSGQAAMMDLARRFGMSLEKLLRELDTEASARRFDAMEANHAA